MDKTRYKGKSILFGLSLLVIGITINCFSAEIANMFLNIDTAPLSKGIKPYSMLQTNCAKTMIEIISICADIAGIFAIIYGCISKRSPPINF